MVANNRNAGEVRKRDTKKRKRPSVLFPSIDEAEYARDQLKSRIKWKQADIAAAIVGLEAVLEHLYSPLSDKDIRTVDAIAHAHFVLDTSSSKISAETEDILVQSILNNYCRQFFNGRSPV